MNAITIIKMEREYWVEKRSRTIARQDELNNQGDKITATAVGFSIDQQQETISSMTGMIKKIENITQYQNTVEKLINKNNK